MPLLGSPRTAIIDHSVSISALAIFLFVMHRTARTPLLSLGSRAASFLYQCIAQRMSQTPKSIMEELFESGNDEIMSDFPTTSQYWPENLIHELVQERSVRYELDGAGEEYSQELVDFILRDGRKLFVIAGLADQNPRWLLKAMQYFKQNGFKDSELSVEVGAPPKYLVKGLLTGSEERPTQSNSEIWSKSRAAKVCSMQWKVLVPVLSTEKANYDFEGLATLPFTMLQTVNGGGAFSTVYQVEIQEGHFKDPSRSRSEWPKTFAVKKIIPPDETERQRITNTWANEAETLRKMNVRHKEHILRFITAFTRPDVGSERSYYLVFEWADGGCLNDLFTKNPSPILTATLVKEVATQLLGLAEALKATHELEIRHGDIKPGNILHFKPTKNSIIGTLKIGDWGLAKYHPEATVLRLKKGQHTDTRFGTTVYEPPEVELGEVKLLSRQYDIWSIGCVILEIIIWLVYGNQGVNNFRLDVQGSYRQPVPYYTIEEVDDGKVKAKAKLQKVVEEWMDFIAEEPVCDGDTALGELLLLVRKELLVVELPPNMGQTVYVKNWEMGSLPNISVTAPTAKGDRFVSPRRYRATSADLVAKLGRDNLGILDYEDRPDYYWLIPGVVRRAAPRFYNTTLRAAQDKSGHLTTRLAPSQNPRFVSKRNENLVRDASHLSVNEPALINYKHPKLDDEWEIRTDERFASKVLSHIKASSASPPSEFCSPPAKLCDSCKKLDFFRSLGFSVEYSTKDLETRSKNCELCALFLKTAEKYDRAGSGKVRFDREQSWLRFNNAGPPVLSICRSLDSRPRPDIYLGLPKLPEAGSQTHFEIIKQWLRLCDDSHPDCRSFNSSTQSMPTRVIDVGHEGDGYVRLWETGSHDKEQYVALSHPWGNEPHFVTNTGNLEQHKEGIRLSKLPVTFQDAIHTTRALGKRYLWIDSICIIQGPGGDFHTQAKQMETVFSSASCVIAASRAHSQTDGFLLPRRERDYVTLTEADGSPFYICEHIDDFNTDVLNGHLNKRGWVLQEHALARRTVFFAQSQTYFECGDGVRCETLTKMSNNLAAFLGDPHFPRIVLSASQGERIIRLQDLFKTYSTLDFTRAYDRPIAMDGINCRLLKAFGANGGYGIFDEGQKHGGLLRRSLLWYRPADNPTLARIQFPKDHPGAPSWSWMAYTGEIDFLRLKFGEIEWMEIRPSWPKNARGLLTAAPADGDGFGVGGNGVALWGRVRDITVTAEAGKEGKLFYDIPGEGEGNGTARMQCVVLGVERSRLALASRRHYFILVRPVSSSSPAHLGVSKVYERVGAGYLPGKYISAGGQEAQIF